MQRGFHLIELLIALSIIAILATLSTSNYTQHVVKARRLAAASALEKLAMAIERYHIEHNTYQGANFKTLGFSAAFLKNIYVLKISANENDYVLSAKPLGNQAAKDIACATLSLDANGEKHTSGNARVESCW